MSNSTIQTVLFPGLLSKAVVARHSECMIGDQHAEKQGYEAIWYHRMTPEIAYAYLERPGDPLILELSERPWDGGNVSLENWITQ